MESEIGIGMSFGIVGDLSEPRARDHDAGGSGGVPIEGIEAGGVLGVSYREVVGMDDEEFGVARISKALGDGF